MKAKEEYEKKKAAIRAKKDADGMVSEYITRQVSEATGRPMKSR